MEKLTCFCGELIHVDLLSPLLFLKEAQPCSSGWFISGCVSFF
uniref:Uncharacterized protein n=1 Tax=Anguilla anguilla TaxID=7936 RepID=A0A0E9T0F0_ANGAN